MEIVKVALKAGSSKQGKACRANVASNCVTAATLVGWYLYNIDRFLFKPF